MDTLKNTKKLVLAGFLAVGTFITVAGASLQPNANAAASTVSIGSLSPNLSSASTNVKVPTDAGAVLRSFITIAIVVGALLALYYLIMGAIAWITSDGDKGKVEEARNKMTFAIIGLLVLASVWAIYRLVLLLAFGSDNISLPQIGT